MARSWIDEGDAWRRDMVVQHNLTAANTGRQLKLNTGEQAKAMEKLSSGYRINRAADDAAGLTISEKMRHQIRGLERGATNSQEGVSLCQVADGALAEVSEILHRITELSVQAANDTNTDGDRRAIQKEIHQLLQEIDRIGDTTEYNTQPVFQGGNVTAAGPNNSPVRVNSVSGRSDFMRKNKHNLLDATYKLSCSGDSVTLSTDANITKPSGDSGDPVKEVSSTWDAAGLTVTGGMVKAGMYKLTIGNNSDLYADIVVNVEKDITLAEFNQAMDGARMDYTWTYAGSNLHHGGYSFGCFNGGEGVSFRSSDGVKLMEALNLDWGNPPNNTFRVVLHRDANGEIYGELPNGIRLTGNQKTSIHYPGSSDGVVFELGYKGDGTTPECRMGFFADISKYDFEKTESGFVFPLGDDVSDLDLWMSNTYVVGQAKFIGFTPAANSTADSLTAPKQWWIQSGDTNGNGFFIEIDKMNARMLGVAKLDVSTGAGAQEAIDLSQKALDEVSKSRSKIGAQQNRLEHTISNVKNTAENAQAAESRIRDADMAKELVKNSVCNILMQAGQSIFAQNNQEKSRVLELLT